MINNVENVKNEASEVFKRVVRLSDFIESEKFKKATYEQRILLPIQLQAMLTYHTILEKRIKDLEISNGGQIE